MLGSGTMTEDKGRWTGGWKGMEMEKCGCNYTETALRIRRVICVLRKNLKRIAHAHSYERPAGLSGLARMSGSVKHLELQNDWKKYSGNDIIILVQLFTKIWFINLIHVDLLKTLFSLYALQHPSLRPKILHTKMISSAITQCCNPYSCPMTRDAHNFMSRDTLKNGEQCVLKNNLWHACLNGTIRLR